MGKVRLDWLLWVRLDWICFFSFYSFNFYISGAFTCMDSHSTPEMLQAASNHLWISPIFMMLNIMKIQHGRFLYKLSGAMRSESIIHYPIFISNNTMHQFPWLTILWIYAGEYVTYINALNIKSHLNPCMTAECVVFLAIPQWITLLRKFPCL